MNSGSVWKYCGTSNVLVAIVADDEMTAADVHATQAEKVKLFHMTEKNKKAPNKKMRCKPVPSLLKAKLENGAGSAPGAIYVCNPPPDIGTSLSRLAATCVPSDAP